MIGTIIDVPFRKIWAMFLDDCRDMNASPICTIYNRVTDRFRIVGKLARKVDVGNKMNVQIVLPSQFGRSMTRLMQCNEEL